MFPLFLSVCVGVGLSLGDVFMKKWMLVKYSLSIIGLTYLISGLVTYCISLVGYAFLLKYFNLNVATTVSVCFNVLTVMFVGTFIFGEKLSLYHFIGILFCLIGLCFIFLK